MRINPNSKNAIKQFKHIKHLSISGNKDDGFLDLFLLPINARNFDYNSVSDNCTLVNDVRLNLYAEKSHMISLNCFTKVSDKLRLEL